MSGIVHEEFTQQGTQRLHPTNCLGCHHNCWAWQEQGHEQPQGTQSHHVTNCLGCHHHCWAWQEQGHEQPLS